MRLAVAVVAVAASGTSAAAATSTPDDPGFRDHQQWGLTQAGFPDAWCRSTGAGALIVVIDTGIDATHPDLKGKLIGQARVRGGELTTAEGAAADDSGHGTHVAGIAAAVTGDGIGVAGAAPDARLYAIKVLFAGGDGRPESGSQSDLVQAIDYASGTIAPAWPGPVVLNLSIGAADASAPSGTVDGAGADIDAAIERASQRGLGVAVAAGNAGTSAIGAAAVEQGAALAVGALDQNGVVAPYSPTAGVSIFAAGGSASGPDRYTTTGILSTWPHSASGDYAWMAGTSMASPHVAAALALLMSSGLSSQQAYARLLDTADAQRRMHVDVALGSTTPCGAPPVATPASGVRGIAAPPRHVKPAAAPLPAPAAPAPTPTTRAQPTPVSIPARPASAPTTPADSGGASAWWTRAALGMGAALLLWLVLPRPPLRRRRRN